MNREKPQRNWATRVLASAMAIHAFSFTGLAHANPGDIFSVAAPALSADQPAATPIQDGEASVATKTGAFEYAYPITVPPGRNGMQPHVQLAYSSQASTYGTIAAGWSLNVPIITLDTTDGRLSLPAGKVYQSTMAGNRPLIPTSEPAGTGTLNSYRAQNDSGFVRYERTDPTNAGSNGYYWRAKAPSGNTFIFGDTTHAHGCSFSDVYAPLTTESDAFGNAVDYSYRMGAANECVLDKITWGQNAAAGIASLSSLAFNYSLQPQCGGMHVGSQTSYRSGIKTVTGASRLDTIVATATSGTSTVYTRTISLGYDAMAASCSAAHSAYRSLVTINESASGTNVASVTLPPVSFKYGTADVLYDQTNVSVPPWNTPENAASYNMGWGYRFTDGRWPTVEAMMLDIDGDGLVDRVRNTPRLTAATKGDVLSCAATWDRNNGDGTWTIGVGIIDLPTLKWRSTSIYPPALYDSGAFANANSATSGEEACSLNYQLTQFANSKDNDGFACSDGSACPCMANDGACIAAGHAFCTSNGNDCGPKHDKGPTILAYRWVDVNGDGRVDVVASIAQGGLNNYDLQQGNGYNAGGGFALPGEEPPIFGEFPKCHSHGVSNVLGGGYTMCGNEYPWFVYLNHRGTFGLPPQPILTPPVNNSPTPDLIEYQPGPLESQQGDSSIMSHVVGASQAWMDLDGDGYADQFFGGTATPKWLLYKGDSSAQLSPQVPLTNTPYSFSLSVPQSPYYINLFDVSGAGETSNLLDINGDGLPDRWFGSSPSSASVAFNDGTKFRDPPEVTTPARPSVISNLAVDLGPCTEIPSGLCATGIPPNQFIYVGWRLDIRRPLDVDADGRVDIATSSYPYFNQGGQFAPQSTSGQFPTLGTQHIIQVSDQFGKSASQPFTWEIRADMLDIDGDGIPEGLDFGGGRVNSTSLYLETAKHPQPPRLLIEVDNHRGATTSVEYVRSTDPTSVTHDSAHTLPHPQWLVKSQSTHDVLANTTDTSTYAYNNPEYSFDDRGHYGFRGFGQVTTTRQSGAQLIERFSFTPDWSGRLATKIVRSSAADAAGPVTIDDTTWVVKGLFAGSVRTFLPTARDHWTCPADASPTAETSCRANAANHRREVTTWTALTSASAGGSLELLWEATLVQHLSTNATGTNPPTDGDRAVNTDYYLMSDSSTYRLRAIDSSQLYYTTGTWTPFGKSYQTWDSTFRVATVQGVYVESSKIAETRREFDMLTGNILKRWKPIQNAAHTTFAEYRYDPTKMFVTQEINELNQSVAHTYEPGTGKQLTTVGPNVATCAPSCPPGTLPSETHTIVIDAIGRTIERQETFSEDGFAFTPYPVELITYSTPDYDTTHQAATIRHRGAIDGATGVVARYKEELTELDGLGRASKKTDYSLGSAPANQVTTYTYANDSTLSSVSLPDPSHNDATIARYDYAYDSLGRPKSIRRPDALSAVDRSGIDMTYNGLVTTSKEILGVAGGSAASTRTTKDRYDRIATVEELAGASTWRTTSYQYSPDDNISMITDPEGVKTLLTHDWGGRRLQINRPGATWSYGYDLNGNMWSEQLPCSGAGCALRFTTITFDDLDRVKQRNVAPRDLSAPDRQLFGSGMETFNYDVGPNRVGRLYQWATYAPGSPTPTNVRTPSYNAQGQTTNTEERINIPGYTNVVRNYSTTHQLDGQVRDTYYYDAVGSTACPNGALSEAQYDNRGLLSQVQIVPCLYSPTSPYSYVANTRNVAGLVTERSSIPGSGTIVNAKTSFTYDVLGRVSSQTVAQGPTLSQVAKQSMSYYGNDDVKQLVHSLGTSSKTFNYTFDTRHELTSAVSAVAGYFSANYGYGAAGRLASVIETSAGSPGTDVAPRNVTYEYLGTDPEEVTRLASGANTFASYSYDQEGNQTARCLGGLLASCTGTRHDFTYDGNGALRRATKRVNGVVQGSEEYWYNDTDRRQLVLKRNAAGVAVELVWYIGETEAHYDASGATVLAYAHVSMGTPALRLTRTTAPLPSAEYQFHGIADSTLASVDQATGITNVSFSYAPFGEVIEATNSGGTTAGLGAHDRRHNDVVIDAISDLSYYGYRYYDRYSLTWTQADPIARFAPDSAWMEPRRAQLYTSDLQNPMRYRDPDGRENTDIASNLPSLGDTMRMAGGLATAIVTSPEVVVGLGLAGAVAISVKYPGDMADHVGTAPEDQPTAEESHASQVYAYDTDVSNHINVDISHESDLNAQDRDLGSMHTEREPAGADSASQASKPRGSSTANPQGGANGQGGAGAGGNNRRPETPRGPGGGKQHTPGHNRKSVDKKKENMNKRAAKAAAARDATLDELRKQWDGLRQEQRNLHGGDFEKWAKTKL